MKADHLHTIELINRCKTGDRSAQFMVYERYYKAMFNTAYRIVNDHFEAEDIMQEAFLAAFDKLETFSEKVTFGAWLKKIVINKSVTTLKRNNRLTTVPMDVVSYKIEDVAPEKIEKADAKHILHALSTLKSNYKIALTLHLIEGYDYEEIAQIMDISYENSRTTISRAKSKLRNTLLAS